MSIQWFSELIADSVNKESLSNSIPFLGGMFSTIYAAV